MSGNRIKIAVLDLYKGHPNQGLRCIRELLDGYKEIADYKFYDVRGNNEIPDTSYDIYISSGGPGNPLEGDGTWDKKYYGLVDQLWESNQQGIHPKKFMFFICHSFQMACHHFGLGKIAPRKSASFGILPIHKTKAGKNDPLLANLPDPFYAVESRDWQIIQPRLKVFEEHGAHILALEKIRTHVEYERAIMAVRFSTEFVGVQFHPEAEPVSMKAHFSSPENKIKVIATYGEEKYNDMMYHIGDPDKIATTYRSILPGFIESAFKALDYQKNYFRTYTYIFHGSGN